MLIVESGLIIIREKKSARDIVSMCTKRGLYPNLIRSNESFFHFKKSFDCALSRVARLDTERLPAYLITVSFFLSLVREKLPAVEIAPRVTSILILSVK